MNQDSKLILSCHNLAFKRENRTIISSFDLALAAGEIIQIIGENGVGKSSLLRTLAGLLPRSYGDLFVTKSLFYLAHDNALKGELTVAENIFWDIRFRQLTIDKVDAALHYFDLLAAKDRPVAVLSQGQRRRVTLVKCYLAQAELYILDEPLAALDQDAVGKFIQLLHCKLTQGAAVVITSHQPLSGIEINYTIRL